MRRLILFLSILVFTSAGLANVELVNQVKRDLQFDLNSLVRQNDPSAFIIVNLKPYIDSVTLPGTPFSLKTINLDQEQLKLKFKTSEVKLVSDKIDEVKKLEPLIKEIAASYAVPVTVEYVKYSSYLMPGEAPATDDPEKKLTDKTFSTLKTFFSGLSAVSFLLLAFGLFFVALFVGQIVTGIKSASKLSTSLESGFGDLSSTMKDVFTNQLKDAEFDQGITPEGNDQIIPKMPVESLEALLFDCYWCELDGYAKYVWNQVDVTKQKALLEINPLLSEYIQFLSYVDRESYYSYHKNSYYLAPLNINYVSNNDLAKWLRKSPENHLCISPLRKRFLNFDVSEQAEMLKQRDLPKGAIKVPQAKSSLRSLEYFAAIEFSSFDQEEKLIELKDLPFEVIKKTVSAIWSLNLKDDDLRQILQKYSAKDLAQAWIGPEKMLSHWKNLIQDKKLNLIYSYAENTKPSRHSSVYIKLHKEVIDKLNEYQAGINKEVDNEVPIENAA